MSAVLNNIYNNYLTTYAPRSTTKFDSHKKSELRGIYNTIVKLNKESPWYLPTNNKKTQQYAVDIKENARQFYNTLASAGALNELGLSNHKVASTSNKEVVTAKFVGSQNAIEASPTFSLEVHALASPQENMGIFLKNTETTLSPNTYSFDIAIADMNYEFQFSIEKGERNGDIQERLARLINNADIGIGVELIESENKTSLRLTSDATGTPFGKPLLFNISDNHTTKVSGTVKYFGLDFVSHEPSNSIFSINGEDRSATSNHFTVGKMFEVDLVGVCPEGEIVAVGLKTDTESLTDNIDFLTKGYNDFLKTVGEYIDNQPRSQQLVKEMTEISSLYNDSFEQMGITFQEDGHLNIDKSALSESIFQSEDLDQNFGFLKGFTNQLLRKATQVSIDPMNYVEKTMVAYKNPNRTFFSPYITSAYSGMMFNGYC